MFGGLGGLNPKKMQEMMKKLGMEQEEISALRVIIEKSDGSKIFIENPSVSKISIQGQESFQVSGNVSEKAEIRDEDIETVMKKTGVNEEQAKKVLEETNGDLVEAILKLS